MSTYTHYSTNETKVKSIFLGKVIKKVYEIDNRKLHDMYYLGEPRINEKVETIRREKVAELELDRPPFQPKEEIYLTELGKYATIEKVTRSTDGSIVYNITYVVSIEGEEESKQQYEQAKKQLAEELIKYNAQIVENDKKNKEQKQKQEEQQAKENADWEQYLKERNKNIKNIKGVFVQKIKMNDDGFPVLNTEVIKNFKKELLMNIPNDYIVVNSPMDIEFYEMPRQKDGLFDRVKGIFRK